MLWAHSKAGPDLIHITSNIIPIYVRSSVGWGEETSQNGHRCCLSCTIVSQKRSDLAFVQVQ